MTDGHGWWSGSRVQTVNSASATADATTGEVDCVSNMELFADGYSDYSRSDCMAAVTAHYQVPVTGWIEVWVVLKNFQTYYWGSLDSGIDLGCPDADIQQLSRIFTWIQIPGHLHCDTGYSTIVNYERGNSDGSWSYHPTPDGNWARFFSQNVVAAGDWVTIHAGIRDLNYFSLYDKSCQSSMWSKYFVDYLAIRSTGV